MVKKVTKQKKPETVAPTDKPASKKEPDELIITSQEFPHYQKNQFWHLGVGLLGLALLILAWRARDYLAMAVVVSGAIAVFRLSEARPQSQNNQLTRRGVRWGSKFIPYFQIKSFWLAVSGEEIALYLERLNLAPTVHIIIRPEEAEPVASYLSQYIPWHQHRGEPLTDKLGRFLKV